jgi:hypothetical protein
MLTLKSGQKPHPIFRAVAVMAATTMLAVVVASNAVA